MKEVIQKYTDYADKNNWMVIMETQKPYYIEWLTPTGNYVAIKEYYDHLGELYIFGIKIYPL